MMRRDRVAQGAGRDLPFVDEKHHRNDETLTITERIDRIIAEAELERRAAKAGERQSDTTGFIRGAAIATTSISAITFVLFLLGLLKI